jgi:ArsR family transcriptional regulator
MDGARLALTTLLERGPTPCEVVRGSTNTEEGGAPVSSENVLCPPLDVPGSVPGGVRGDEDLALLAKALGHPVRAGIVRLLARQDSCQYGDLTERLPLAKSTVSQHLKVLREAGLVRGEVDGPRVCYCIDPVGLQRLKLLVAAL